MQTYLEETLEFIESEEMRAYLRKVAPEWLARGLLDRRTFAQIIASAPSSLERKIPVLEAIAGQIQAGEADFEYLAKFAKQSRMAFDEKDNNQLGTIFWLKDFYYSEENGDFFFSNFDAAIRFIKEQLADNEHPDIHEYQSYDICKLIPGEKGTMIEYCHWILNFSGEIWYFDYFGRGPKGWEKLPWTAGSLNLPVPFTPGDIILADCRPFAKERRVLILEIGDNRDCCAVQCLYPSTNSKLNTGAFKHNRFLHLFYEKTYVSGLYRATRWTGELTEQEAPLAIIGMAVKANPVLGRDIWEYFYQNRDDSGITWEQLQVAFGF